MLTKGLIAVAVAGAAALAAPAMAFANAEFEAGTCSAALFQMEGMTADQPALVLTAGHCLGIGSFMGMFPNAGEVFIDAPYQNTIAIEGQPGETERYASGKVLLGTMTGIDIGVIELDLSYSELLQHQPDAEIYTLSREAVQPGDQLSVVSLNYDQHFSCVVESLVPLLREGPWEWSEALRFEFVPSCIFFHGISGSPVIDAADRIVGVAVTIYEGGAACDFGNPCEIVPGRAENRVGEIGQSYAVQTHALYDCYDAARKALDFARPECSLVPPELRAVAPAPPEDGLFADYPS